MCGINGFNFPSPELVLKMNEAIHHRGPDATDIFVDEKISFGHNLLAITEQPQNSKQPFVSLDRNYAMVFNGEIYNYHFLRQEMKKQGENFVTDSDTEVLFKGLMRYGKEFLLRLDGMFAIAFYNKNKNSLLVSRDSSGIKPVYYYWDSKNFVFSSEIKGILKYSKVSRKLSQEALKIYFLLGYVPGKITLFKDIFKVCPGEYLELNLDNGSLSSGWLNFGKRYYENFEFNDETLRKKISKAVTENTQGLRPLGLYLSGGLDSSVIYYELFKIFGKKLRTYTTSFSVNDPYYNDDSVLARRLTSKYGNEHHELVIKESEFVNSFEGVIECMEEPRWNPHIVNQWLLAKEASKDVTVVLNGSGGDELFLGYHKHLNSKRIHNYYKHFSPHLLNFLYTLRSWSLGRAHVGNYVRLDNLVNRWAYINNLWYNLDQGPFRFENRGDVVDLGNYLQNIDAPAISEPLADEENAVGEYHRLFWLSDEEFLRTDKITMHYGMEGRFPLLARDLQFYANSIASSTKLKDGILKRVIRDSYRGILPDYIIDKPKTGWKAPAVLWMDTAFGKKVREVLRPDYYEETRELFAWGEIDEYIRSNSKNYKIAKLKQFLPIFSFQIWAKKFGVTL